MSFVGDKKIAESMLKDNATVFSETENMLRGPKYEALVARYLSSKRSWFKKLFGFIKNQRWSKEGNRREPLGKDPLFRTRGNRVKGMLTTAGQASKQQYPTGGKASGKNEFINSTFNQLDRLPVSIRILQNTSASIVGESNRIYYGKWNILWKVVVLIFAKNGTTKYPEHHHRYWRPARVEEKLLLSFFVPGSFPPCP